MVSQLLPKTSKNFTQIYISAISVTLCNSVVDLWVPIAQCDGESAISHSWFCPIVIHYIGITTLTQDRRQLQIQIENTNTKR